MAQKTIVTHDGTFHADDVFAVAALRLVEPKAVVLRTRDDTRIQTGDFVVDVGGVCDAAQNRFDHHQVGGAGGRENGLPTVPGNAAQAGIPYAAFGLVWKKFGERLSGGAVIAARVEEILVMPIDANDNGINLSSPAVPGISSYELADVIRAFIPTWREKGADMNAAFMEAVSIAKRIIAREIKRAEAVIAGQQKVKDSYRAALDKRLIVLDEDFSWKDTLARFSEPLYVVHPVRSQEPEVPAGSPPATRTSNRGHPLNGTWRLYCVRDNPHLFVNRKDLPASWAGLRDEELSRATGVADAVFCHRNRFMAVAKTKEGAVALAKQALANTNDQETSSKQ